MSAAMPAALARKAWGVPRWGWLALGAGAVLAWRWAKWRQVLGSKLYAQGSGSGQTMPAPDGAVPTLDQANKARGSVGMRDVAAGILRSGALGVAADMRARANVVRSLGDSLAGSSATSAAVAGAVQGAAGRAESVAAATSAALGDSARSGRDNVVDAMYRADQSVAAGIRKLGL